VTTTAVSSSGHVVSSSGNVVSSVHVRDNASDDVTTAASSLTFNDYFVKTPEYRTLEQAHFILSPFLVVLGTVSDVITLRLLRYRSIQRDSMVVYMYTFCASNLTNLLLSCGLNWILHVFGYIHSIPY